MHIAQASQLNPTNSYTTSRFQDEPNAVLSCSYCILSTFKGDNLTVTGTPTQSAVETGTMASTDSNDIDISNHPDLLPPRQTGPRPKCFSICCKPKAESEQHTEKAWKGEELSDDTMPDIPNLDSVSVHSEEEPNTTRHMVANNVENVSQMMMDFLKLLWTYLFLENLGGRRRKPSGDTVKKEDELKDRNFD